MFRCRQCSAEFNAEIHYKFHLKVHQKGPSESRSFVCYFCLKHFTLMYHRLEHMRLHTMERPYKCQFCPSKTFTRKRSLQLHQRVHDQLKPFKCPTCLTSFSRSYGLNRHTRKRCRGPNAAATAKPKPFICRKCKAAFTQEKSLNRHCKESCPGWVHVAVNPLKCFKCNIIGFTSEESLSKHLSNGCPGPYRPFKCPISTCSSSFSSAQSLGNHVRVHRKSMGCPGRLKVMHKPFSCPYCNIGFTTKNNLRRHLKVSCRKARSRFINKSTPALTGTVGTRNLQQLYDNSKSKKGSNKILHKKQRLNKNIWKPNSSHWTTGSGVKAGVSTGRLAVACGKLSEYWHCCRFCQVYIKDRNRFLLHLNQKHSNWEELLQELNEDDTTEGRMDVKQEAECSDNVGSWHDYNIGCFTKDEPLLSFKNEISENEIKISSDLPEKKPKITWKIRAVKNKH